MSLAVQLEELAWQLKKERLFINSEREQMQKIYEDVKKVAEALYHVSWIMRQQRTNLEMLVTTIHGIVQSGFCAKAKQLESINFIDSYKQLGYHDIKFADLLKYLRDNPKLVAQLISCGEKRGIEGSQKVVGIVLPSLYGNCVMLEDEYMALQLLYTLAENQLTYDDNPRRLIRKGSCAFSKLFKNFFDSLFSSKLFLTAALHDPVMKLLMEDEWFYDIDPDKALVRFTPSERMRRFGEQGSTEWKTNLQNYRNFIVDKLVTLSNRFISAIKNNMYCFPVSLSWLVSQIYQLLSKSGKHSAAEVRAVCADLVFALFICPAIWDPAPYGIMSDVPISHIARHNLMQIAQIIQVLAFSQTDDIPPKFSDLYDKFDKGCLSGLIDIMLEGVGPDAPSVPSNHPQNIERSSVLITLTQLNTLVNFLRSTLPHMNKSNDINQLEELLSILPAIQTPTLTIQPSTPTSITPSHTPPGTPSSQRKTNRAHKKKMSLTNPEDVTVSSANVEQSHVDGSADLLEDVLVFSLGVTSECPGMLPECKVLSAEQERCRRKVTYQSSPTYEDNNAETHEKRTRFSFPQDQESIGNTSDIQEAISEVASSHSVGSLENDNDNFSDMISANVSGRGTPNVSGRDTPLSQAESVEERRAPDLPETVQKQNREDVTERFGKFEIKSELENETKSTVSDTWSTDVLASDSEGPDQNQLERLEEVTEEMVRQNLLGVAEPVSEVSETASDAWSTDVLASDTEEKQAELIQEIEQDDMNSVTDRSLNQDELESSCTLDRNEQTPLASGRESPDEERELEGLGAVGGVSSHRHRRSHGTDRVTFKASKSADFLKKSPTSKSPVTPGLADIGPDGNPDGFKLLNVPRQRLSATFKQAQGKVTAMLSALDHHSKSRFIHPFQENTYKNFPAYDPTPLKPVSQSILTSDISDLGFNSPGEEEHSCRNSNNILESLSTSKDSGIMDSPQSEPSKINEYMSPSPVRGATSASIPTCEVDLRLSEQQNSRLDEQRLSAALRVFDPLVSSNSNQEDSGGSSSSSTGAIAPSFNADVAGTSLPENSVATWSSQLIDEVFTPVESMQQTSSHEGNTEPATVLASNHTQSSKRVDIATPFSLRGSHNFSTKNPLDIDQDFDGDFKGEKKKGFFKSFKEKINKGMKKRGKSDRDDLFSEEFGACGDAFDGGGNGNFAGACVGNNVIGGKNFVCPETGDEILAKYRKKPNLPSSQSLDMTDDNQKDKHPTKEEQINEVPYYDPNNLENCFAFADAKRKLRLVLSVGDYQNCSIRYQTCGRWMPSSPCDNDGTPGSGGHWKETELVHILSVQLAEAINLRNKEMVAQLHEVIRCIKLFDNEGCKKLFKLLEEDYKGRAHYVAYLTRCKQGLLTSLYFLQGLLQRAQREKEICNNHLNNVCVQRFIESKDKLLSNFIADFQKLTMSDEKEDLVERFLNGLYQSIQTDALWQGCSESQLQSSCIALERYVMGRIYTHAMFPNGDGDILRDQLIHEHIKNLSQVISPTHKDLCIPKIYQFECPWPAAQREIHMINAYKTPKDKVQCVYRCSLCIMNLLSMANDRKVPAADDFFPVLIYVIIKANPPCLLSTIQYVNSFYGERVTGEEQYWWMQFFSAVKFIKTMD
ncbi:GTPase-activating protein and VPS9 domain-containing protein 1 isoform X2 [Octopus bimaculoides]|uniref:GTPase-activating protein and VPS9 domain-containing protein 1 n=1 Tax=Octopus bimaculoides TaxID=37653 RepID=A0A0L8GN73_OCTBM|nr:GTPase-activating protein and VPS9 domain-containing protein 1 isoform X2 [Octopus bimaculoides]|eukprot:XP_014779744.1 PREDICTED: GTPase-activating protein and VPS9 domain-containing protein 1-like isoform X2 [Octopus bimaculoides]